MAETTTQAAAVELIGLRKASAAQAAAAADQVAPRLAVACSDHIPHQGRLLQLGFASERPGVPK